MRRLLLALMLVLPLSSFVSYAAPKENSWCLQYVDDCEYCKMIEELYANEPDEVLRLISEGAMKSCIHPNAGWYAKNDFNARIICTVGYDKSIVYRLNGMGLESGWPRTNTPYDDNIVDLFNKADGQSDEESRRQIQSIYDFIVQTCAAAEGMTETEKINYFVDVLDERFQYDTEQEIYKLGDVLDTGKTTCVGFSELFYLLCLRSGIYVSVVGSPEHMYDAVWIDNGLKFVDVTGVDCNPKKYRKDFVLVDYSVFTDELHKIPEWYKIF